MALNEEKLVVGTAGRRTLVWDLRNMSTALQKRESSLKYQTRCIKCFPSRQGFVLSSIEGKDIVKQFNLHEVQNVTLYFISPLLFF
jgi:cell cycle arrest protein BUB3